MDIKEFFERFGVSAQATHLLDFVTHVGPDEEGGVAELIERQWVVVYQYPDTVHGDQRVFVVPYATTVNFGVRDLELTEALRELIAHATAGTVAFEEYLVNQFHPLRVRGAPGTITIPVQSHPLTLYGEWHAACGLYHRLREWCDTPEMRDALDLIDVDDLLPHKGKVR